MVNADEEDLAAFWKEVFRQYDDDGSGELDIEEFTDAMRRDAEIPKHKVPDEGLVSLFNAIDTDSGGTIDSEEFSEFLELPYQPEPAFTTLYELVKVDELQEHVFDTIRTYMNVDPQKDQLNAEQLLRREMAAVALEELSGQPGCIDKIFADRAALETFIRQFQREQNDKVASALAYVLINFAAEEKNLDLLFEAGIFDDLASAIRGASKAKTESLIIIVGGVVKKHASRASGPIVDIFGELIETEQWEECKTAALAMLLNFCDMLPQFCADALAKMLYLLERGGQPSLQLPSIEVLSEITQLKRCVRPVTESGAVQRVLAQLRRETALAVARKMGACLCTLTSFAPPGEKIVVRVTGTAGAKPGVGLARFKDAAKRVIEHRDTESFVFTTVMQQLQDKCRFPAITLQQLVASELKDHAIGRVILDKLRTHLRMQNMAEMATNPGRRPLASDALAIIAAEPACLKTPRAARTIEHVCHDLLPYEFGFERVACRAVARMAFESRDLCDDISLQLLDCLKSSQWAVREGAACTFGIMCILKPADRPVSLAELSAETSTGRASGGPGRASPGSPKGATGSGAHVVDCVMAHDGVAALLRAVRDEEFDVSATACLALGNIAGEGGAIGAHAVLDAEGRPGERGAAVLAGAMTHMDGGVRTNAAAALGALGSHTRDGFEAVQSAYGLNAMVAGLKDKVVGVRTALAFAIGQVVSGSASQLITAPVLAAHEEKRAAQDADDAAAKAIEDGVGEDGAAAAAENRKRRVVGFAQDEDSDDEDTAGAANSSWGTTRATAPVVVIPGTNAAVDALLRAARDDMPAMRAASMSAVSKIFFPAAEDGWIRDVVAEHAAGLRYKQGERLAAAERGFNKAALEMKPAKRIKLEALCSRARDVFREGGKTAF